MTENICFTPEGDNDRRKRMSSGLYVSCPHHIKVALHTAFENSYDFIITQITHPSFARELLNSKPPAHIGRTDRILKCTEWNRLIVAEISPSIHVDCEVEHVSRRSKAKLLQELGFAAHLGVPAVLLYLSSGTNAQLGQILNNRMIAGNCYNIWISIPMVHPSRYSPLFSKDEEEDTWNWWNNLRRYCNYERRLGVVLEFTDVKHVPSMDEIDRWMGEPVRALVIPTSLFIMNHYGKPVLPRTHQEIIQKFLSIDVQYIIKPNGDEDLSVYAKYINFLGKKLFVNDSITNFIEGCEHFLQNPIHPLSDHLEANTYEMIETDQIKYTEYQNAIHKALEDVPADIEVPIIMIVGAGRGPLVQATLNVSYILQRNIKVYAVEKNPYAVNTLIDRVENEWGNQVTLVNEDMRVYRPPVEADILVSELLGSFGDNELAPECLDGAQRFLKKSGGVCIPCSYTSYLAPLHSIKIFNEIKANRPADKTLQTCYEMPYNILPANYYQIAPPQALFKFEHPNWSENISNERYKKLKFNCTQDCVLTAFAGFFDTVLYKDVTLSIHPETHTKTMLSWFPIVFPLLEPVQVSAGSIIEVSFWRTESSQNVCYEWCLESPVKGTIMNPNGRSFSMKKH